MRGCLFGYALIATMLAIVGTFDGGAAGQIIRAVFAMAMGA